MRPETEAVLSGIRQRIDEERMGVERPELSPPEGSETNGDQFANDDWLPYLQDINDSYDLQEQAYQDKLAGTQRRQGDVSLRYLKPGQKTVMGIDVATGQRALNRGDFNNPDAATNYTEGVKRLRGATLNVHEGYDMEGLAGAARVAAGVLAEGGEEPDFNRAMDMMGMPRWQTRAAWNSATQARLASDIEESLSEPYTAQEEAALPPDPEEDLTRQQLMQDVGWQEAASKLFEAENGQAFEGSPQELMTYFVDEFTNFNWKIAHIPGVGSSSMAYYAARAMSQGEDYAQNFLTLMDYYDRLQTDFALFADAFTDVFADPTTYVGLGGGAIGAKLAARVAKNRLRKGLTEYIAAGMGAGAVEGAVYGGIDETQRQRVEVAAGEREDIDVGQVAAVAGVSAGAGVALGGVLGAGLSPRAIESYKRGARQMMRNASRPRPMTMLTRQTGSVGGNGPDVPSSRRSEGKTDASSTENGQQGGAGSKAGGKPDPAGYAAERSAFGRDGNLSEAFARESGTDDRSVRGIVARYTATEPYADLLTRTNLPNNTYLELTPDRALDFHEAITKTKASHPFGAAVYVYDLDDYADMRLFLSEDGGNGFALKPDGDIVSVFSAGGGSAYSMLQLAVEQGGTKLDCFDTVLPRIYGLAGFKEVKRDPWVEEYAPEDWDKALYGEFNNGEPDIVYMEYSNE